VTQLQPRKISLLFIVWGNLRGLPQGEIDGAGDLLQCPTCSRGIVVVHLFHSSQELGELGLHEPRKLYSNQYSYRPSCQEAHIKAEPISLSTTITKLRRSLRKRAAVGLVILPNTPNTTDAPFAISFW
jgi:hypothetical protein